MEAMKLGKLFYLPFEVIRNESVTAPVLDDVQLDAAMAPFEQDDEENDFDYERQDDQLDDPDRNINDPVPEAPEPVGLRAPRLPSFAEQEQHRLHHEPFAALCEECVQGRAHALPHRSARVADRVEKTQSVVQVDYQLWNLKGQLQDGQENRAATSLTLVDTVSGAPYATVVDKKGHWNFAEDAAVSWLNALNAESIVLQCDNEPAILDLCRRICKKRVRVNTTIRTTATYSSSSNGAVESANGIIAGRTRTWLAQCSTRFNMVVGVSHLLFPWAVRHSAWVYARFAVRKDKTTPYFALRGANYSGVMVQFGEAVHYRIANLLAGSKALPRWFKGIWGWQKRAGRPAYHIDAFGCDQSSEHPAAHEAGSG